MRDKPTAKRTAKPVGTGAWVVEQGECLISIAVKTGHVWETIWNDGANAKVKQRRKTHTALLPGDRLHIPKLREEVHHLDTDKVHRFRRKGIPSELHVIVRRGGEPRANMPYVLTIDGHTKHEGKTNADGEVKHRIDPLARGARLVVGKGYEEEIFTLRLGHMDPIEEVSGVQGRLLNLGYDCGRADGVIDDATIGAWQAFQKSQDIEPTDELDDTTRQALEKSYGG